MDDGTLVAAMVAGDPHGLEGAYRRYADRLHAYCRSLLKDGDSASDVVHDTFLVASQKAGDLRDPARLQAWLYTIARRECLRVLRARRRSMPLPEADEPAADPVDPTRTMQADQIRELVHSAAAGLSEGDREVIELSVRHELSAVEVGSVLGVSANHAHARMSRARAQLHRSLGALLVARSGRTRCPALTELTRGWNGAFTPLLRKRVSRHVETCSRCAESQRELLSPAQLLPAYGALPFLPVPAALWARLEAGRTAASASAGAASAPADPAAPVQGSPNAEGAPPTGQPPPAAAEGAPPATTPPPPSGAPLPTSPVQPPPTLPLPLPTAMARAPVPGGMAQAPPTSDDKDGRLRVVLAAASLALLVLAGAAGLLWWRTDLFSPVAEADGPPSAGPGLVPAGVLSATATASPTPAVTTSAPEPTTSAPEPPPQPPPQPPPAPFTVTAEAESTCISSGYRITVSATASHPLERILLYWHWVQPSTTKRIEMTLTGTRAATGEANLPLEAASADWWVEAQTTDGREFVSSPVTVQRPCTPAG